MRLSFSKLDRYESCPYAYRFRYVERVPVPFTPRLAVGAIVHAVLRSFFERLRDGVSAGRGDLIKLYQDYWEAAPRLSPEAQPQIWERGQELLHGFWEANRHDWGRPVLLEARFRTRLAPSDAHVVEGVIDRVDEIDGGVEIIDYKSGGAPQRLSRRERTQLHTYARAVEQAFAMRPVRLSGYFLRDNRKLSMEPDGRFAVAVAARYGVVARAVAAEQFGPTPGPQCARCDYAGRCPHRWRGEQAALRPGKGRTVAG